MSSNPRPISPSSTKSLKSTVGRLKPSQTVILIADMQEKFESKVKFFSVVVEMINRMLKVAKLLNIPVIVTEQHPKGLGPTVQSLAIKELNIQPIPKTQFTMITGDVERQIRSYNPPRKSIILCGIETHITVQLTALDLLDRGFEVHVLADACSSRSMNDRKIAFKRIRQAGAYITTCESAILTLTYDSRHPKFKEIRDVIGTPAPTMQIDL